jgi:hypothetical protein
MDSGVRYCGRNFPNAELQRIKRLIADNPESSRAGLSRLACDMLDWRRPDGGLKDMSCRVVMIRMQDDGLIQLPPPGMATVTVNAIFAAPHRQSPSQSRSSHRSTA